MRSPKAGFPSRTPRAEPTERTGRTWENRQRTMSTSKIASQNPTSSQSPLSRGRNEPSLESSHARRAQLGRSTSSAPSAEASPRLNGSFVQGYDRGAGVVEPERGIAERFRRDSRLRDRAQKLVLQAHREPVKPEPKNDNAASSLEIILDDSNLLPFDFLRTGDRLGRAVVKIQRRDGAAGTGFLVAPGILLTNHHVLPDADTASESTAAANYEANPPDDPAGRAVVVPLRPSDLFVANEDLDFAFCAVRGLDHLGVIPLNRNSLGVMQLRVREHHPAPRWPAQGSRPPGQPGRQGRQRRRPVLLRHRARLLGKSRV